eukprot:TCONS_00042975-protein
MPKFVHIIDTSWEPYGDHLIIVFIHCIRNPLSKASGLRPASISMYESINEEFPLEFAMFGNLCRIHRSMPVVVDTDSTDLDFTPPPDTQDFRSFFEESPFDKSPTKYKLTNSVNNLSESTVRYHKRKYKDYVESCKKKYKEMVAPGQVDEFSALFSSSGSETEEGCIPEDLKFLHRAYQEAESEKQKTLILSAIPKEQYSIQNIMNLFSCTKYRVQQARKWAETNGALNFQSEKPFTKNKLNIDSAEHFVNFLFQSNLLQDVAYGTSTLEFADGSKQLLPKSVLTLSKTHTISAYKEHCRLINFTPLSDSTLWQILKAIKPGQRRAMAGLDNNTSDGLKGFQTL